MSTSPLSLDPIIIHNVLGSHFLDLGCGYGKWGFLLKRYRRQERTTVTTTGVDLYESHIRSLAAQPIYDRLLVGNARDLPFADKSFDSTIGVELIEHLPKSHGKALFEEMKRVSRSCFVITTPN